MGCCARCCWAEEYGSGRTKEQVCISQHAARQVDRKSWCVFADVRVGHVSRLEGGAAGVAVVAAAGLA